MDPGLWRELCDGGGGLEVEEEPDRHRERGRGWRKEVGGWSGEELMVELVEGVFAAETDEIKTEEVCIVQGESETLHSGVKEYHQITWTSGNTTIATCRGNTGGTGSCEIKDERFRDRLMMDNQTGSLTFINISTDLTGLYQIQIINKSSKKTSYKKFNVAVCAPLPFPMIVKDSERSSCSQCVLKCSVMNVTEATLSWYKDKSLISSSRGSDLSNSFSLPLEVNYQDSNIYSCVLNNSISNKTKHLNIPELCPASSESGYIVLGVLGVLGRIGVAAALISWK